MLDSYSTLPQPPCSVERPGNCHFCQIHQTETALTSTAVRYLKLGAVKGENLAVITNESRQELLSNWLNAAGIDVSKLLKTRRLFFRTSRALLEGVFVDGTPDWDAFRDNVMALFEQASWGGEKRVRFYGDAVSELWAASQHDAVIVIEQYWAQFSEVAYFDSARFCGYVIDAFDPRSYSSYLPQLGQPHDFVLPPRNNGILSAALDRAGRDILGITLSVEARGEQSTGLPDVFRNAFWLSQNYPSAMSAVLHGARRIYSA